MHARVDRWAHARDVLLHQLARVGEICEQDIRVRDGLGEGDPHGTAAAAEFDRGEAAVGGGDEHVLKQRERGGGKLQG